MKLRNVLLLIIVSIFLINLNCKKGDIKEHRILIKGDDNLIKVFEDLAESFLKIYSHKKKNHHQKS